MQLIVLTWSKPCAALGDSVGQHTDTFEALADDEAVLGWASDPAQGKWSGNGLTDLSPD